MNKKYLMLKEAIRGLRAIRNNKIKKDKEAKKEYFIKAIYACTINNNHMNRLIKYTIRGF